MLIAEIEANNKTLKHINENKLTHSTWTLRNKILSLYKRLLL